VCGFKFQSILWPSDLLNLYELMGEVEQAMRRATIERIRLLGGEGRA
jgi:hypothetical protein